jgi:hypothetical protein
VAIHHRRISTTKLSQRACPEEHRCTQIIPRFFDERSSLKLIFAPRWQASERWNNVQMSDTECEHLDQLRREATVPDAKLAIPESLNPAASANPGCQFWSNLKSMP